MENKIYISDDGTMDTVVIWNGKEYRYDSDYRYSFPDDEDFIESVLEELESDNASH